MKKIAIVVRENDLYAVLVPKMIEWLKEEGHEASATIFPRSMSKEEIEAELKSRKAEFEETQVFYDDTCCGPFWSRTKNKRLDKLCDDAHLLSYTDGLNPYALLSDKKSSPENIGTIIANLLSRIVGQGNGPERVHVITERIGDHTPFGYKGEWEETQKEEFDQDCAPVVAGWFAHILGENSVEISSAYKNRWDEIDRDILREIDQPNSWVIVDRHLSTRLHDDCFTFNHAIQLQIPLSNFFQDVQRLDLLQLDADKKATEVQLRQMLILAAEAR